MRGTVVIFAKAPRAGAVKTRLGTHIGMGRAAALFRIMTERTSAEVSRGPWRTIVAVDPPSALAGWRTLFPPRIPRIAQGRGDLGQRMARVMNMVTEGPVIIVGADAPGMRARHLRNAFAALARADAVFGPATDGGYWLIGLARRRSAPGLFQNVRWTIRGQVFPQYSKPPWSIRSPTLMSRATFDISDCAQLRGREFDDAQMDSRRSSGAGPDRRGAVFLDHPGPGRRAGEQSARSRAV
jgi:rSAM/selenodomain-associated transferase 1